MWKKKEPEPPAPEPVPKPAPAKPKPAPATRRPDRAIIGPTLKIQGEISGEEDLLIQGQIDGKIVVHGQSVTIGKAGQIKADIHADSIRVEGRVRGDLCGTQEVVIEATGDVEGNLIAPSVRLENGSRFKGSIDMESARQSPVLPAASRPNTEQSSDRPTPPSSPDPERPPRRL